MKRKLTHSGKITRKEDSFLRNARVLAWLEREEVVDSRKKKGTELPKQGSRNLFGGGKGGGIRPMRRKRNVLQKDRLEDEIRGIHILKKRTVQLLVREKIEGGYFASLPT